VADKKGSWIDFPGALTAVIVLGGFLVFLVAAWPTVAFHGNARWIGEALWVGIPALIAGSLFAAVRWKTRDERKLRRLRDDRLRAEGKHPTQLRNQQLRREQEQQWRAAEQKRQAAEQMRRSQKEAAELRKQQVREEIGREERLREERMRKQQP